MKSHEDTPIVYGNHAFLPRNDSGVTARIRNRIHGLQMVGEVFIEVRRGSKVLKG
jgi:hypothetical protein